MGASTPNGGTGGRGGGGGQGGRGGYGGYGGEGGGGNFGVYPWECKSCTYVDIYDYDYPSKQRTLGAPGLGFAGTVGSPGADGGKGGIGGIGTYDGFGVVLFYANAL